LMPRIDDLVAVVVVNATSREHADEMARYM
jgi:hypothetical protein